MPAAQWVGKTVKRHELCREEARTGEKVRCGPDPAVHRQEDGASQDQVGLQFTSHAHTASSAAPELPSGSVAAIASASAIDSARST